MPYEPKTEEYWKGLWLLPKDPQHYLGGQLWTIRVQQINVAQG